MQEEAEGLAERFARIEMGLDVPDLDEPNLEDFGFYYPIWYSWPLFVRYHRSRYTAYPREGGYGAQDEQLMTDLERWGDLVSYKMRRLKVNDGAIENPPSLYELDGMGN